MKTRLVFTRLLISVALFFLTGFFTTAVSGEKDLHDTIDKIVEADAKYDLFSGTILVARDGETIYARGIGYANKEYRIPNSVETQFNISSVQKTFIATVIMQLCQEGRISLDDPLKKYFPDCPYETADRIQIRHLLNHTSGLGGYRDNDEYQARSESYTCIDDVLPAVYEQAPAFAPGERFRYSNAGVLFLKAIIERVEEMRLEQVLEQRIFEPLAMGNTALLRGGELLPHRATAYVLADDGESYRRVLGEPAAYAGGGIYTCALDLLEFDQALYGDELLDETSKEIMFTPVESNPDYAYGWEITQLGGTPVVYHGGGSGGFNCTFRRYPEAGYTVIVLSNYPDNARELADKIDSMLFGQPYELSTEADMIYKRGMFFQGQEDYVAAIDAFQKNIERTTPHLPSLYQSAKTRILGEFEQEEAIELLDVYIELATDSTWPSIAAAWWRKGVAWEQLGRTASAIDCYKKSAELDPGFEYAHEALERLQPDKQ